MLMIEGWGGGVWNFSLTLKGVTKLFHRFLGGYGNMYLKFNLIYPPPPLVITLWPVPYCTLSFLEIFPSKYVWKIEMLTCKETRISKLFPNVCLFKWTFTHVLYWVSLSIPPPPPNVMGMFQFFTKIIISLVGIEN